MTWINEKLQLIKTRWEEFSKKYFETRREFDKKFYITCYAKLKYFQIILHVILLILCSIRSETKDDVFFIALVGNLTVILLNIGTLLLGFVMVQAKRLNVYTELGCLISIIIFSFAASIKLYLVIKPRLTANDKRDNPIDSENRHNGTQFINISANSSLDSPIVSEQNNSPLLNLSPFQKIITLFFGKLEAIVTILYISLLLQLISAVYAGYLLYEFQKAASSRSRSRSKSPQNVNIYKTPKFNLTLDNISERSSEYSSKASSVIDRDEEYAVELNYDETGFNNRKSSYTAFFSKKSKRKGGDVKNYIYGSQPSTSGIVRSAQSSGNNNKSGQQTCKIQPPRNVKYVKKSMKSEIKFLESPNIASQSLTSPSTDIESLASPSTASESLVSPSTVSESLVSPSTASKILSCPNTASESLAFPGTDSESLASPSTASESLASPGTDSESLASPSTASESLVSPSTASESLVSPSTASEILSCPNTASESLASPSIAGDSLPYPSTVNESLESRDFSESLASQRTFSETLASQSTNTACEPVVALSKNTAGKSLISDSTNL